MDTLVQAMEEYVCQPAQRLAIEQACEDCERELLACSESKMAWRVVDADLQLAGPAAALRSLWVFAFSPDGKSETHKHSNSTQYTRSWRGSGYLQVGAPDQARTLFLPSKPLPEAAQNWVILTPGSFHQARAGDKGWCVVSFHTVAAAELQEEAFTGTSQSYIRPA